MEQKLFLIGNAHIDPVWLWLKPEGLAEIKATFRSALDRMKEFDGYIFTSACAYYYKWIEENEPEMFEEIKERVNEGRWAFVGGMWVQPDCNIPCGESFARHLLYSQRYFLEKFSRKAEVGYNVDSFGHNGMLPQLLLKSGIRYYVFMRPNSKTEKPDLPENIFWWESPDGSRVLTYRLPQPYCDGNVNKRDIDYLADLARNDGKPYMYFYGVGNHGGGPTIESLKTLESLKNENLNYASPKDYFKFIENRDFVKSLRIVREDLQHHASGCYSANSTVKRYNRISENKLLSAEKFDILANLLLGSKSNARNQLKNAWEKLMFNQFHDILAGCCIKDAYNDAYHTFGAVCDAADEVKNSALQRISWNINTFRNLEQPAPQKNGMFLWESKGEGTPIVVFNPHSFPVRRPIKILHQIKSICDRQGKPLEVQQIRGCQTNVKDRYNYIFMAYIPPMGYSTYYLYKDTELNHEQKTDSLHATAECLENRNLSVRFNTVKGWISSITDKSTGRIWNSGPFSRAVVIDNAEADTWAHKIYEFRKEVGEFGKARLQVLDNGPLKATVRATSRYKQTILQQDFSLYRDSKEVEVKCKLLMLEKLVIIKLSFPVQIKNSKVVYSMPYGYIAKDPNGLEEVGQAWIDVNDGESGLSIINNGKYSFDVKDNDMRMTVARSCIYADHFGERDGLEEYQDIGEQEFSYIIYPHAYFKPHEMVQRAAVLNQDVTSILETHHQGPLESSFSGISVSTPNVIAEAVKIAEDGKGIVLRCYETDGVETDAKITFTLLHKECSLRFCPQEIKTLYFGNDGNFHETDIIEES